MLLQIVAGYALLEMAGQTADTMPRKTFEEVLTRFREIPIPEDFDLLVAIANGGIIPAAPLNLRLNKEVRPLRINLRDECQRPKYDKPKTAGPGRLPT